MSSTLQYETYQDQQSKPLRRQRLRVSTACEACRLRKVKCDGGRPACSKCHGKAKTCTYSQDFDPIRQQIKRMPPIIHPSPIHSHIDVPVSPPASDSHSLEAPSIGQTPWMSQSARPEHFVEDSDADPDPNRKCFATHGRFSSEVAAAIDVRAGLAPAIISNLVPFVDAPLFGEIDLQSSPHSPRVLNFAAELPPRPSADELVSIYWEYVDPMEPILDRESFFRDYDAAYSTSGTLLHVDHDVWLSMLNIIFALAVQRQESAPVQQRSEEANCYFRRAWALLPPQTILWKPGSVELVQCLMLMNRYLHCTNNQQKTWVTAGLAIRIGQTICCHLPEASASRESDDDKRIKQRVWASCVSLDRCVSWSFGRTSASSMISSPIKTGSTTPSSYNRQGEAHAEQHALGMELHEIGNQILLAQTQTSNTLAARLGLPHLYQQDEYYAVAVQLDACLNKWEHNLPDNLKLQDLQNVIDRASRAKGYMLHLRLLHSRIFLYRPMLARFYSLRSHTSIPQAETQPLSMRDRILKESAAICVETAQNIASLIIETLEPASPIGLLPWWHRIYYLHIAGTSFLAAMFRADLYTASVAESWNGVIMALRAHEHLSAYVGQCLETFETLERRLLQARCPNVDDAGDGLGEGPAGFSVDDIFQDLGFDFDAYRFGTEDFIGGQY